MLINLLPLLLLTLLGACVAFGQGQSQPDVNLTSIFFGQEGAPAVVDQEATVTFAQRYFNGNQAKMNKTLARTFDKIDSDGNGTIDQNEFYQCWTESMNKWLQQAADEFDIDSLDQREIGAMVQSSDNSTVSAVFSKFDSNQNGQMDKEEFISAMTVLWSKPWQVNSAICGQVRSRVLVCDLMDQNITVSYGALNEPIDFNSVFAIEDAQCRLGISSSDDFSLENCVMQAQCSDVIKCYESKARPSFLLDMPSSEVTDLSVLKNWSDKQLTKLQNTMVILAAFIGITMVGAGLGFMALIASRLWTTPVKILGHAAKSKQVLKALKFWNIFFTVTGMLAALLVIIGGLGLFGSIKSMVILPRRFDALQMPKLDYSKNFIDAGSGVNITEPGCEIFAYWPKKCSMTLPGFKLESNVSTGLPLRQSACDHGGELWSGTACQMVAGIGKEAWSDPCGAFELGCRPMCYKTSFDKCIDSKYYYTNSTDFMNVFLRSGDGTTDYINPSLFTKYGYLRSDRAFYIMDYQSVLSLHECEAKCSNNSICNAFFIQAPSQTFSAGMKCTLLAVDRFDSSRQVFVSDYRQIIGDGTNSLANDDKPAPFVIAVSKTIFQ